jgi:hypothetical protein
MGKLGSLLFVGLGLLVTVVASQAAWQVGASLRGLGDAPGVTSVANAAPNAWLRLDDAAVRCETRRTAGNATYFDAASRDGKETFLVQTLGEVKCEDVKLEGGFLPGRYTGEWVTAKLKIDPPPGSDVRIFSQMLTPEFLRKALYTSLPMVALGLLMTFVAFRTYRRALAAARGK